VVVVCGGLWWLSGQVRVDDDCCEMRKAKAACRNGKFGNCVNTMTSSEID
jgi:hypothetical protein